MIQVDSSNLAAIGYDENTSTLTIQFKSGAIYEYYDVPQFEFDNLMGAESKGTRANQNIYKRYRQQKIA